MDQHPSVATKYRELEGSQIRLLSVDPGSLNGPISCTMHHVPLDERPEYVALSYTWGDANDKSRILLNGKEHDITRSLFTALQRFRYHCSRGRSLDGFTFREGMYLWTDALCINQEDMHEKGRQIPRMSEIYTRCSRVCVWLGLQEVAVDPSHVFQELLEEYREYCEFTQLRVYEMDVGQLALLKEAIEEALGDVFVEGIFRVLCNLASRAWFRRVWVIQEAALPAKDPILMAGPFLFGFESFTRVCEMAYFIWGKGEQAPPLPTGQLLATSRTTAPYCGGGYKCKKIRYKLEETWRIALYSSGDFLKRPYSAGGMVNTKRKSGMTIYTA